MTDETKLQTVSRKAVEDACDTFVTRMAGIYGEVPPDKDPEDEGWPIYRQVMRAVLEQFVSNNTPSPASLKAAVEAISALLKAYKQLIPGARNMAIDDYANLNEAPLLGREALRLLSTSPSTEEKTR